MIKYYAYKYTYLCFINYPCLYTYTYSNDYILMAINIKKDKKKMKKVE